MLQSWKTMRAGKDLFAVCAKLSTLVYLPTPQAVLSALLELPRPYKDMGIEFIENVLTDTQVFVFYHNDTVYIVFRGTQVSKGWSWPDIIRNFNMDMVDSAEGKVHDGYDKAVLSVASELSRVIMNAKNQQKQIVLSGHSLGGSLATIACARCNANMTVTFGAPRVGNGAFATHLNSKPLIRIARKDDLAIKHPFWTTGYRHGGAYLQLTEKGKLRKIDWTFYKGLWLPFTHKGVAVGQYRHKIGGYYNLLATGAT